MSKLRSVKSNTGSPRPADCADGCAGRAHGFPMRREFGFTDIEEATLESFRCLCDVYTSGSAEGWEVALRTASEILGPADGPLLVARVTTLLRALKAERLGNVQYLGFGCHHVCPDELAVLTLIKSIRLNDSNVCCNVLNMVVLESPVSVQTEFAAGLLARMHQDHLTRSASLASPDLVNASSPAPADMRRSRLH